MRTPSSDFRRYVLASLLGYVLMLVLSLLTGVIIGIVKELAARRAKVRARAEPAPSNADVFAAKLQEIRREVEQRRAATSADGAHGKPAGH